MIGLYYRWSAFHLLWKLLANGIRNGWLFTKGYSGLLATIELGADGVNVKPYVRLFAKHGVSKMMKNFAPDDLSIHQLHEDHFWPPFLGRFLRTRLKQLEPIMSWYVTYKGRKPKE